MVLGLSVSLTLSVRRHKRPRLRISEAVLGSGTVLVGLKSSLNVFIVQTFQIQRLILYYYYYILFLKILKISAM